VVTEQGHRSLFAGTCAFVDPFSWFGEPFSWGKTYSDKSGEQ
jgi:hypothetical protein